MTKEMVDLVLNSTPPDELTAGSIAQDLRSEHSPTHVWLRRVAFLLAAASPVLGCSGSGSLDPCAAYAAKVVSCDSYSGYSQEYVEQMCDYYLAYSSQYGVSCHAAFEDYYACISRLSCTQIENDDYSACTYQENQLSVHCDS